MMMMTLNKNMKYSYLDTKDTTNHIKVEDGIYAGVVYKYNTITVNEISDQLKIDVTFDIIKANGHTDLGDDTDFRKLICDILDEIINYRYASDSNTSKTSS
jgi:hypothetical protein